MDPTEGWATSEPEGAPAEAADDLHPGPDTPPPLAPGMAFDLGRAFSTAIAAVRRAPLPLWVGAMLLMIAENATNALSRLGSLPGDADRNRFGSGALDASDGAWTSLGSALPSSAFAWQAGGLDSLEGLAAIGAAVLAFLSCLVVVAIGAWVFQCVLRTGFIRLQSHILQTAARDAYGPLFSGADRLLHMLAVDVLSVLAVAAAMIPTGAPAMVLVFVGITQRQAGYLLAAAILGTLTVVSLVYVSLGLVFAHRALVLEGLGPVAAIRRSWFLARGARLSLLLYLGVLTLAYLLVAGIGLLACCVGTLVTGPLGRAGFEMAFTESYLLYTRGFGVRDHWELSRLQDEGQL
ncbi:MAG: hypothetical protein ACFCGT_06070 [Sandaracinaceae bacterium]